MSNHVDKSYEELKQIAIDLRAGKIFCDRHLHKDEDIRMVFMVLTFLDGKQIEDLKANPPGMIYEYLDQAGPRSCNGNPIFFSCRYLSRSDTDEVIQLMDKLRDAEQTVTSPNTLP